MKKADWYKQYINELLLGDISLESAEVFKAYFQLKAYCFSYECKGNKFSYRDAIKRFEPKDIDYLINEGYVKRYEDDYIHIKEISDCVDGLIDYNKVQGLKGNISVLTKEINMNVKLGKPTSELKEQVEILKLEIAKVLQGDNSVNSTSVEQVLNKC